jgi:hypothetical protein
LEVTIRGLPDIKNPPSPLINPFNPQESLSLKFFWGLPLHVLREAEAGSPIKGGLRGAQYQHGDLYHAWKRKRARLLLRGGSLGGGKRKRRSFGKHFAALKVAKLEEFSIANPQ